ncbi:hypothetical protein [Cecembia lonarensis]|uniref:Small multi-drug export protein n=1 Tax=Cecembia lonarensis (strain CCUG 58316 / KCTC 22772 / LW9) TaxID=1225176 RepID=K1LXN2_CECL9|nr:hypothetical protein [Cecembia lonarensis]EKB48954.1 hypothetical protein B879_02443 [Cecembia lonarensis LW9]
MEYFFKFIAIWFTCLFKFIAGPILGAAANYSLLEIIMVTVAGMMSSVAMVTFLGDWFKSHWTLKVSEKKFTKKKRRIVKTWQKFGPGGIAALTPIILTPIGGSIILTAFNVPRRVIMTYMLTSGLIWSLVLGSSINWLLSIPFFDFLLR